MMSIIIVQFIKIIATRGVELNKKKDEAIGVNELALEKRADSIYGLL